MHQPAHGEGSSSVTVTGAAAGPGVAAAISGYLQKNYHIADGNLYSVLTPSTQPDKPSRAPKSRGRRKARWKLKFHHQALPPEYREHYEAATEAATSVAPVSSTSTASSPSTPSSGKEERLSSTPKSTPSPKTQHKKSTQPSSSRSSVIMSASPSSTPQVVDRTSELPYMGEITLDSKPRRGRKPKKADICHLIYKNYGTVFPPPKNNVTPEPPNNNLVKPKISWTKDGEENKKIHSQNTQDWTKPTSSLLEKRLTGSLGSPKPVTSAATHVDLRENCLQNGMCDKLSTKRQINTSEFSLLNKKDPSMINLHSASKASKRDEFRPVDGVSRDPELAQACVQRLLAYAAGINEQNEPLNLCVRDRVKAEPSSGSDSDPEELTKLPQGLSPVENTQPGGYVFWPSAGVFVHPQLLYKPPSPALTVPSSTPPRAVKKKRKRSAIFIPPAESPTEVSICKFKFTGGAKPSLEEKKMLSVDAGGNFRFYSGTDKGMRSFLPHLQHPPVVSTSSPSTPPSRRMNLPHTEGRFPVQSSSSSLPLEIPSLHMEPPSPQDRHSLSNSKRKRRSRKSEVREKLEQTFKEKGFLIQTQQLESAEGATYCKFRQLRKFTRYLFRSWRDYLPHSIQDLSQAAQQQQLQDLGAPSSCETPIPTSP